MNKLLICYDISDKNITESTEYDLIKNELEKQDEWVHLQKSVWVVVTKATKDEMFEKLNNLLDKEKKNTLSVVNITKQSVQWQHAKAKINNEQYVDKILSTSY
jgi:CRISPR/Cas system-associated endoribonuclease Cas2